MPRRPPSPPRLAAVALLAGLALVAAAATSLPETPLRLVAPLAAHAVHLAAAFALGRALLRLPGAAPRQALDLLVSSLAIGMAGLALLSLAATTWLACSAWVPWVVDGVALLIGLFFGQLGDALDRIAEPWRRREMAVIVASRLPLHLALCLVAALHVVPPFLPPTAATGADALALPAQAMLRGDLAAACSALPQSGLSPTQGLLIHGMLTGGPAGALLFGATALALLAAVVWLHAERHLGDRAAAWSLLVLLSTPLLLSAASRDPSVEIQLLFAFLAFHEVADWCQRATGGKIALAATYGGILVAESGAGLAAFAGVLLFLFLVQAFIDRNGVMRQVPGLLGMAAIALVVASPFVGIAATASPATFSDLAGRRAVPHALRPALGMDEVEPAPRAPSPPSAGVGLETASHDEDVAELVSRWARIALLLGPLMLGLLAALPLVPEPAEPLRHAVLGALIFAALALLPPPHGAGAPFLLAPAALAAGGIAVVMLAERGRVAQATALFAAAALPASLALALAAGPDIPLGAGHLLGRVTRDAYLGSSAPDAALAAAVTAQGVPEGRCALLVGDLTDVLHAVQARRVPELGRGTTLASLMTGPEPVDIVAVDRATAHPRELAALAGCRVLDESGGGRWALLAAGPEPIAPEPVAAVAAEPVVAEPVPAKAPEPATPAPSAPAPSRGTGRTRR